MKPELLQVVRFSPADSVENLPLYVGIGCIAKPNHDRFSIDF